MVNFFLLDALLWNRKIEFVEASEKDTEEDTEEYIEEESEIQSDDFDKLLDDWIREMEAEYADTVKEEVPETLEPTPAPEVDPFDHIEVIGLNLYNINCNKDDNDRCLDEMSALAQTAFAADRLKMLSVIGKLKVRKDIDLLNRDDLFKWIIYDQTGRMVDWRHAKKKDIMDELWVCVAFGDFCKQNWSKGTYRIELKWQEATVINTVFTVGDIDVTSVDWAAGIP